MKIILSPTKKMRRDVDFIKPQSLPCFLSRTEDILRFLKSLSPEDLKKLWGCNDAIAEQNIERLDKMDLHANLTPAILAYEGIAFQYMAPGVFTEQALQYVQDHLRILSGFYGVLKPLDGVRAYRLEMQAKARISGHKDLYSFWGQDLYDQVRDESGIILNLASKEYSRCIEDYLKPEDRMITCEFLESVGGKLRQKATFAKMARGEMVRFLAENQAPEPQAMQDFSGLGYHFRPDLSTDTRYIFERIPD